MVRDDLGWEHRDERTRRLGAARVDHREVVLGQQVGGGIDLSGREPMPDRVGDLAVVAQPLEGPPMQEAFLVGSGALQLGRDQVTEQVVIPIPTIVAIQRDDERVGTLQLGEGLGSPRPPGHGITQITSETAQNRRLNHEIPFLSRERLQHLANEVFGDIAIRPTETRNERTDIVGLRDSQPGKPEPGRPTLGTGNQNVAVCLIERWVKPRQQLARLQRRQRQVCTADLDKITIGTHPAKRDRHRPTRRNRHPHTIRHQQHKPVQRAPRLLAVDDVEVVEEQMDRRIPLGKLVTHRHHDLIDGPGAPEQPGPVRLTKIADDGAHRGDDRPPQRNRVVVGTLE